VYFSRTKLEPLKKNFDCYLMIKLFVYQMDDSAAKWSYSFLTDIIQIAAVYDVNGDHVYSS